MIEEADPPWLNLSSSAPPLVLVKASSNAAFTSSSDFPAHDPPPVLNCLPVRKTRLVIMCPRQYIYQCVLVSNIQVTRHNSALNWDSMHMLRVILCIVFLLLILFFFIVICIHNTGDYYLFCKYLCSSCLFIPTSHQCLSSLEYKHPNYEKVSTSSWTLHQPQRLK